MRKSVFEKRAVENIYSRWAPVYDLVFGPAFTHGRQAVASAVRRVGGKVLEVGVGTGISLPYYSENCRVVGIDICDEMLARARQRVARENLRNVERLVVMDAEHLEFSDASYDVVAAVCVINTVPDPEKALEEFARVLKPGGEIILLNRMGAEAGPRLFLERAFQPVASRLGWRSEFPWIRFARWLEASSHEMSILERQAMPPFGHFSLLRFGKSEIAASRRVANDNHVIAYDNA